MFLRPARFRNPKIAVHGVVADTILRVQVLHSEMPDEIVADGWAKRKSISLCMGKTIGKREYDQKYLFLITGINHSPEGATGIPRRAPHHRLRILRIVVGRGPRRPWGRAATPAPTIPTFLCSAFATRHLFNTGDIGCRSLPSAVHRAANATNTAVSLERSQIIKCTIQY